MRVFRAPALERTLLDQIRASFGNDARDGIHLSDLLNPRRSYWQRVLPMSPTDHEIGYWVAGRAHEDALGRVAGLEAVEQRFFYVLPAADAHAALVPISYRPDFNWLGQFAEFKTRRANLAQPGEEAVVYDSYLDQLRGYCSIEGRTQARLIVFSLLEGERGNPLNPTHPEFAVYNVEFTQQELDNELAQLHERRDAFEAELLGHAFESLGAALGGRAPHVEPSRLPLCKPFMCGKPRKIVDRAEFCETCGKAITHRAGDLRRSHDIRPEQAHWEYEPRCKWYAVCRPQDTDPTRGVR